MPISKRVSLDILRPGMALSSPLTDPDSPRVRLLGAGVVLTASLIDALRRRGVHWIVMTNSDIAVLKAFTAQGRRTSIPPTHHYRKSTEVNDYSKVFDDQFQSNPSPTLETTEHPFAASIDTPTDCGYADGLPNQWAHQNNERVDSVTQFFDETVDGGGGDAGPLSLTARHIVDQITEDKDALVCLSSTPHQSDYPSRHGLHLAGIAMSIGVEMGLDEATLIDLGVGCMIHDVGMRAIGLRMFESKQVLAPIQLQRLADHPVKALKIAGEQGDVVSKESKMVAYQIHERGDGSGYPRGWTADQIHPLAKIAAVADAYVGMLTNRKHRIAIQGYHVMNQLLDEMQAGKFDAKVVRSLLHACSLYPLGSMVTLNNECVGRVIRSGHDRFTEPTVEMWHKDYRDRSPAIVNLKHEPSIRIIGSRPADDQIIRRAA